MTDTLTDLLQESRRRGFLGPGPVEEHLDHARAFVVAAPGAPIRALDLGAGGGLPGLVLAAVVWPMTQWTFLDAQRKRTDFLLEAVAALGLDERVTVVTERAELIGRDPAHRQTYDLVVARSFGPPAVSLECAAPLLVPGGALLASEPPRGDLAARWPDDGVAALGGRPAQAIAVGTPPTVHLVRIVQDVPVGDRYPRRVGIPTKRPLF